MSPRSMLSTSVVGLVVQVVVWSRQVQCLRPHGWESSPILRSRMRASERPSLSTRSGFRSHPSFAITEDTVQTFWKENKAVRAGAEDRVDMPWTESIEHGQPLTFMDFWVWQSNTMVEKLPGLRCLPTTSQDGMVDFASMVGDGARITNLSFASDDFRKIRMTYYDAGRNAQVFNALWYPNTDQNLPLLGIDLLQFNGGKKHLTVIDFQPLDQDEETLTSISNHLDPIRDRFPTLQGRMSKRFYDENEFFSKSMLFARFQDEQTIDRELRGAFQQAVSAYIDMAQQTKKTKDDRTPDQITKDRNRTQARQKAYDVYSAERDPALKLFEKKFGTEWVDVYVHDFLFSWSREGKSGC